jgi:hypothetical protein
VLLAASVLAQEPIYLPRPDADAPITIAAEHAQHWQQGSYDVWHLEGHCRVTQGSTDLGGPEAVLWIDNAERTNPDRPMKVLVYFERSATQTVTVATNGIFLLMVRRLMLWFSRGI